jgi:hypothetical protein
VAYKRKSWNEKLQTGDAHHIVTTDKKFADIPAGSTMLIATPRMVDAYIRQIPKGHSTTLQQMRKDLAAEYHTQYTCPVTAGIFVRIVAEAAYEQYQEGKALSKITPFWRIIDLQSPAAKKLSFGTELLQEQRKKEQLTGMKN